MGDEEFMTINVNIKKGTIMKPGSLALTWAALAVWAANLWAQSPPIITVQPTNQTVIVGSAVTFDVAVSGTGPFTYQWQWNGTNLPNGIITTVAGNGGSGYSGDGGAATNTSLYYPWGVAVDASGNLFIGDSSNQRIRKVDTNGIITTVAGKGSDGYSGDGGAATNASLSYPLGVAVDAFGNLFIADQGNYRIRKVDTNSIITTVAGNGSYGHTGDGGPATNAGLGYPYDVAVDAAGNLFIADQFNNRIRKVDTNGIITTVAGGGTNYPGDGGPATNASLHFPFCVSMDAFGNLVIADSYNYRIREVDTNGIITTLAGNGSYGYSGDGGAATNARLSVTYGVAVDLSSNLFFVDSDNNRIREVDTNGIITTVAGNGSHGYSGDGGAPINASLYYPADLTMDASGNLFIADRFNFRIRKVALFASFPTLKLHNVTSTNAGNYAVVITSPYGSVTSSIVTLTVVVRPAVSGIVPNPDGSATINFSGGAGETYLVQTTTNLTPPVVWQTVSTNVAGTDGTWQFTDLDAPSYSVRFYRASTP